MARDRFPPGWDTALVQKIQIRDQTQSEVDAEGDALDARETSDRTVMEIPSELVPAVRRLIARHTR